MITTYTRYNDQTGEIVGYLTGNQVLADANGPCVVGKYSKDEYTIKDGEPIKRHDAEISRIKSERAMAEMTRTRNDLLKDTDWTQLPDARVDRAAWAKYRQALRDLPQNTEDPLNPPWPTPPS